MSEVSFVGVLIARHLTRFSFTYARIYHNLFIFLKDRVANELLSQLATNLSLHGHLTREMRIASWI